jgi:hypothetical protein
MRFVAPVVAIAAFGSVGLVAGGFATFPPGLALALPVALVGLVVLVRVAWRRPDIALVALVVGIPFQQLVLARAFAWGVTPRILSLSRFWKELLLALLVVKALTLAIKFGRVDRWAIAYTLVTFAYVAIPFGPNAIYTRAIAAREIAAFVIVFLVARHLPLPEGTAANIESAALVCGVILSGLAFWNHFAPDSWADWLQSTRLNDYQRTLVGEQALSPAVVRTEIAGRSFVRAGSLMTFLTLPYYLAIPVGIAIARGVSGRASRWVQLAGLVCAFGILVTLTRSAIALAPFVAALGLWYGRRRGKMALALILTSVALFPLASSVNITDLVASGLDTDNGSTNSHIERLKESNERLWSEPLGSGLGTSAAVAQRFSVESGITNENWYYQIGTQTGFIGMGLYVALLLLVLAGLARRARAGSATALAALCALAWISLGGVVLHTLSDLAVAWTIWMLAGLATKAEQATLVQEDPVRLVAPPAQPSAARA